MKWLSDRTVERLRVAAQAPDLDGTRYRLLSHIARGGMGAVWLAEDTALGRRVALKILDVPDASGELAARLLREARILARLEHPGIVPIHDVGTLADRRVFYTMKFVEGRRLDQHLEHVRSLPDRLRLFQRICEPVAFAHVRGVLHRDLKPENIMVGPFGEVLVMDWGLAKILHDPAETASAAAPEPTPSAEESSASTRLPVSPVLPSVDASQPQTGHGVVLGTPGYMAPEQARGEVKRLDERADVFALGAILRFLLTPDAARDATIAPSPVRASSESAARPEAAGSAVPRALAAVCAKAMSPDPNGRYASVQELAADVSNYLDGLAVSAYPEGLFGKLARLFARHRTAVLLVLGYLLMRLLLLAWQRR